MDIDAIFQAYDVQNQLIAMMLGTPRLFMIAQIVPFMGGTIVTGQLRFTIVFACYMILHPFILGQLEPYAGMSAIIAASYAGIILKETFLGFALAYLAGIVFWTIQSAGFFIDNQRGASQASANDPLSGEQTSPLGSFFFQSAVYVFFASGAFLGFLGLVYASYEIWPVTSMLPANIFLNMEIPLFFAKKMAYLMLYCILLAGPIVVACLLTDVSLGLINRFASQLNVYVLSMPVKSAVSAFLLLLYYSMFLKYIFKLFQQIGMDYNFLQGLVQ